MTALIVDEVRWTSVGQHSPQEADRFHLWIGRLSKHGRAAEVEGTSTPVGSRWRVEYPEGEEDDARWAARWLQEMCGYAPGMLRVVRR
jgi:hypothetical protein